LKYKKIISIFLILVILFNVLTINIYASPWWDNKVIRWAFVVFASTLNAYNVVASVVNARALFENWWYGLSAYDREDYYNNTKALFNMGIIDTAIIGYGINEWVKENLKKGFNSYIKSENNEDYEVYNYGGDNYNSSIFEKIDYDDIKKDSKYRIVGSAYNVKLRVDIIKVVDRTTSLGYKELDLIIDLGGEIHNLVAVNLTRYNPLQISISKSNNKINLRVYKQTSSFIIKQREILVDENGNFIDEVINYEEDYIKYNYYAGEAVDYPMDEYPEDKPVILPAPNFDNPNMGYDDAGNKVFDGTVEQFLDGALDNNVYYDKLIDNILDGSLSGAGSTSNVNVNTNDGTITWPITGTIDYPDTVIDYPDVIVPESIEEGIGEQTSILGGIASFIENIFAEPSVELDLTPLSMVNIKNKFPFCLPFDLANLITGLEEKKEIPKIDLDFKVFNDIYSIELDFEPFNEWAKIVNWFILITFIIGLIMISRKLIGG